MTILYGFKFDEQGRVIHRLFDLEKMPPDWVDSPDKLYADPVGEDESPRRGRPPGSKNRPRDV